MEIVLRIIITYLANFELSIVKLGFFDERRKSKKEVKGPKILNGLSKNDSCQEPNFSMYTLFIN